MTLGEQLALFDPPPAPPSEPVIHVRHLPESYARVATNGHPWEWIVSRDHVIYGAGYAKTEDDANAAVTRTLDKMKEQ